MTEDAKPGQQTPQVAGGAPAAQDAAAARPFPCSWLTLGLGFVGLFAAAAICVVVTARFLSLRPVNLRQETDALANSVQEILLSNLIPSDRIRCEPGRSTADDQRKAIWHFYAFDVEVPETLSLSGVEDLMRRNMNRREVAVTGTAENDRQRELGLFLGKYRFAIIRLTALSSKPQHADIRDAAKRIADQVGAHLRDLGVAPAFVSRADPVEQEDLEARWTHTHFDVTAASTTPIKDLVSQLTTGLTGDQAQVTARPAANGGTTLEATYAGKPCVTVTFTSDTGAVKPSNLPPVQLPTLAQAIRELDLNDVLSIALPKPEEIELESSGVQESDVSKDIEEPPGASASDAAPPRKVAIIVDDGGYGGQVTEDILALDPHLTLAVLPNTPSAADTAVRAKALGFEVLLHMPMSKAEFPGRISTEMTAKQIRNLTDNALGHVPGAVGVNNHAGSAFTADETAMRRFLEVIKDKSLFFVDSRTTANTKAYEVAKAMGIRAASRDVFLDHENSLPYIRAQFDRLIHVVEKQGTAVAICHFRAHTAKVLAEMLPKFKEKGIELAHVSELVQ